MDSAREISVSAFNCITVLVFDLVFQKKTHTQKNKETTNTNIVFDLVEEQYEMCLVLVFDLVETNCHGILRFAKINNNYIY